MVQELAANFWSVLVNFWTDGVLGIDFTRLLIVAGILIFFYVLRGLFARIVLVTVRQWAKNTDTNFDDMVIEAVSPSLKLLVVTVGVFTAGQYLALEGIGGVIIDNLVRSMVAVAFFWALYNITKPLTLVFKRLEAVLTREMVDWLITATRIGVVLLGLATSLQIWGIQVAPLIAGLGLFGVAVALGAQDLFKNLLAGLSILVEKRFGVGDWVMVDGVVEGTVEQIGFRSTRIRRFDKAPVYVPNTEFADSAVTNFSAMTHRRIYWKIGIEYSASKDQLQQVRNGIEAYVLNNEDFAKPPEVPLFVRIDAFNDSSIDIMLYCFTRTTVWGEWLEIKEQLALAIKGIVEGAGTGFAFPSTSIYLESLPAGAPEIFEPPKQVGTDA
ncbi:Mechanosensitive ion channel [Candidatus Phaeomarinobacter ectocarpi]|uniref:Mechanosensitive ion channel n=1 Tax=Candidatus Phaeomarinibacter ectocarpi TaxID=1458461 RepID=X5ME23_9HYPH|nr:mechanosensitive ion channel family protein [Candidatus Phaeomarinobacter ectocarpi]CDO60657.1 Mechanosensitive ion channel [Candidatus Phaeomarinobacter ectocarpi]